MVPLLAAACAVGTAQAQQGHDDHHDNQDQGRGAQPNQNHGNAHDQQNRGQDQNRGQNQYHGNDQNRGNNQNRGNDFHFRDQDRNQFQSHYQGDVNRWRSHPQNRPHFDRGQRIPSNYRFQAVPSSYYQGMPPPPPGYRYGYYDGYVVTYNPTTRIIGDVLDLVSAFNR
jgi:Ni/Co efflux regulator RcnB